MSDAAESGQYRLFPYPEDTANLLDGCAYVEIKDQKTHLAAAISLLDNAEQTIPRTDLDKQHIARTRARARSHYMQAFGETAMLAQAELIDRDPSADTEARLTLGSQAARRILKNLEAGFIRQYKIGSTHEDRQSKVESLNREIENLDSLEQIPQHQRLVAIAGDPRAGFFPKNTHSLNRVMSWLDYGTDIKDQLKEVITHAQKRPAGSSRRPTIRHAMRAVESLAWEVGDDLIEAHLRLEAVTRLKQNLIDISPSVSLYDEFCRPAEDESIASIGELFGEETLGLAAFVQYLDLAEFKDKARVKGLDLSGKLGPLTSTEDPPEKDRPKDDATPGKRKVVMNQYVRPDMPEAFRAHILDRLKTISVKAFHAKAANCIDDLVKEVDFHGAILNEFDGVKYGPGDQVQQAVAHIRRQIEELGPARV